MARLKILEGGLDGVVQALDATAKGLDRRSSELEAVKQELAKYYGEWTAEAKTSRDEMKALSERLDAGDHMVTRLERLQKGWTEQTGGVIAENAAAHRSAAEKTSGAADKLESTGSAFLESFAEGREAALEGIKREWTRTRRWTVPALAIAPGSCRTVVRGGGGGRSERVRRHRALRRNSGLEGGRVEAPWRAGAGLHAKFHADEAGDPMQLRRRIPVIGAAARGAASATGG